MKRSTIYLCLGVWFSSIMIAFVVGRSLANKAAEQSATANNTASATHRQQSTASSKLTRAENIMSAEQTDGSTLAGATRSRAELKADVEAAFALPMSDPKRSDIIQAALKEYAAVDPLAAIEIADSLPSLRDAEQARIDILEVWASNEPLAALAWAETALADVPSNMRSSQMMAIIRGFAETNPKGAFDYANSLDDSTTNALREKNRLLGEVIETQIRNGGLADVQTTIALLADGPTKENLQREMVDEWAAFDPESAAAYVQALGDDAPTSLKTSLIEEWSRNDPAAAAVWLASMSTDDPAYSHATAQIAREWTRYDLTAPSEWLNSLPASPELDRAVATYTYRASQEDPSTAMSWAESITNDQMRGKMMEQVAANWKQADPDSFTEYLDTSELSDAEREQLESAKSWRGGGGRGDRGGRGGR